jgi:hypothetical protein
LFLPKFPETLPDVRSFGLILERFEYVIGICFNMAKVDDFIPFRQIWWPAHQLSHHYSNNSVMIVELTPNLCLANSK